MAQPLILIIDQSPETRAMYAEYLRHHGYAVAAVATGVEGVRLLPVVQPDLVVTELSSETEWISAIQILRTSGPVGETPMIACSTTIDHTLPHTPAGVDVDVAMAKPVLPRTLLNEIASLLDRPATPAPVRANGAAASHVIAASGR